MRLEDLPQSATVNKLVELIGRGKILVTSASDLATCVATSVFSKLFSKYVKAIFSTCLFISLPQIVRRRATCHNCEWDLHRWLRGLWGFELQTYEIFILLQVAGLSIYIPILDSS